MDERNLTTQEQQDVELKAEMVGRELEDEELEGIAGGEVEEIDPLFSDEQAEIKISVGQGMWKIAKKI